MEHSTDDTQSPPATGTAHPGTGHVPAAWEPVDAGPDAAELTAVRRPTEGAPTAQQPAATRPEPPVAAAQATVVAPQPHDTTADPHNAANTAEPTDPHNAENTHAVQPDSVVPEQRDNAQDPFERLTVDVVARWVAAWTTGRTAGLFRLLAADATIESNLDPDGDFIEILTDFVDAVHSISAPTSVVKPGRAVLLYDCVAAGETFRLAETLVVDPAGLVREVRRVYDLAAVDRLLPGLVEQF